MSEKLPQPSSHIAGALARREADQISGPHFTAEVIRETVADPQVIFVDLDGTLMASDLLYEALILAAKRGLRHVPAIVSAGLRGRAALKEALSELERPNAALLPYREEVLSFLRAQKAAGRLIVLATASHETWARDVAKHLGLFDSVLASVAGCNLKGPRKLRAIEEFCRQRGFEGFAYIGDSPADLPIWRNSAWAIVVAPSRALAAKVAKLGTPSRVIARQVSRWKAVCKVLRPHQWSKNMLLFVPMFLSHVITLGGIATALLAFVAFSLVASSVYVVNDLLDIESDRRHPKKRLRPFASGALGLAWGPVLAAGLASTSFLLAFATLPMRFVGMMAVYLAITSLYSFWLKRLVVVDVMVLAGLYTLRVVGGALATGSPLSEWMLGLSMFLFTSLAFAKRYAELARLEDEQNGDSAGRGYRVADLGIIESLGPASGYLSVLVLALYINSNAMRSLYVNSWALWLICPLLMYWITRVWFMAKRRQLSEDPVVFALKDGVSRVVGVCVLVLVILGSIAT